MREQEIKKLKKAVKEKCLECSGGITAEVAMCEIEDCPLHAFRVELWPSLFDGGRATGSRRTAMREDSSDFPNKPDQLRLI